MYKHMSPKKWLCLFLSFVMILPFGVFADTGSDISGHPLQRQIEKWKTMGYMTGYKDGSFRPDREISRAEFMAVVNRAFGFTEKAEGITFKDIKPSDWYYADIAKAIKAGYIGGYDDNTIKPEKKITNQEIAAVIYKLMKLGDVKPADLNSLFKDGSSVPSWSRNIIGAVAAKGYMKGYADKTFRPAVPATRAEVIAALDSCYLQHVKKVYDKAGIYSAGTVDGSVIIGAGDVKLKNTVINGDLILAQGIGDGNVYLDNVTVKGDTYVKGGGLNSIYIENSNFKHIIIMKVDNKIRVVAVGNTTVERVDMQSGGKLEEQGVTGAGFGYVVLAEEIDDNAPVNLIGSYDKVEVIADGISLDVSGGNIGSLNVAAGAANSRINLSDGVNVNNMVLDAPVTVAGSGKIGKAQVNVSGSTLAITPTQLDKAQGVTVTILTPPVNTPASGGGGGGSGGSGGGNDGESHMPPRSLAITADSLIEYKLDRQALNITITNDTFRDNVLAKGNLTLNNGPAGLTIENITNITTTTARLELTFDRIDFDTNINNFNLTISGSELTSGNALSSNNLTITADLIDDMIAPDVVSVKALSNNSVQIVFDEKLDQVSAETVSNYIVFNGVGEAADATLAEDGKTVTLVLSYYLLKNKVLTMAVENVEDLYGNINSASKTFLSPYDLPENYSPPKIYAKVLSSTKMEIVFDQVVEKTSAENGLNYMINNGIGAAAKAELAGDGKKVTITLSRHLMKGESYKITVTGVADLEDYKCYTIRSFRSDYGAPEELVPPKISGSVLIMNSTTLKVKFSENVEKESAENKANYVINQGIGSALAASLGNDKRTVTLTIRPIQQNVKYKMTISNVADLDGNIMYTTTKEFRGPDTAKPEAVSCQALFNNELRIIFNEGVEANTGARVVVSFEEAGTPAYADFVWTGGKMLNDDTIAVFKVNKIKAGSNSINQSNPFTGADFIMGSGKVYTIESITGINDLSSNVYIVNSSDKDTFDGSSAPNDKPEVNSIEQIDLKTIRIVFSEPVLSPGGTVVSVNAPATSFSISDVDPEYEYTDDGYSTIDLNAGTNLINGATYRFDLSGIAGLTDYCGTPVKDADNTTGYTDIIADYTDDTPPVIENVMSVSSKRIKVVYDEEVQDTHPVYKVTDSNGNVQPLATSGIRDEIDHRIMYVTLQNALSTEEVYILKTIMPARNISGFSENTGSEMDFLASPIGEYIQGASVINGKCIYVHLNVKVGSATSVSVKELIGEVKGEELAEQTTVGSSIGYSRPDDGFTITLKRPLLDGRNYIVTVGEIPGASELSAAVSHNFDGTVRDGGIDVDGTGIITFSEWDATNFVVYVVYDNTSVLVAPASPTYPNDSFDAADILDSIETGEMYYIEVYKVIQPHDVADGQWSSTYGERSAENPDGFIKEVGVLYAIEFMK